MFNDVLALRVKNVIKSKFPTNSDTVNGASIDQYLSGQLDKNVKLQIVPDKLDGILYTTKKDAKEYSTE